MNGKKFTNTEKLFIWISGMIVLSTIILLGLTIRWYRIGKNQLYTVVHVREEADYRNAVHPEPDVEYFYDNVYLVQYIQGPWPTIKTISVLKSRHFYKTIPNKDNSDKDN